MRQCGYLQCGNPDAGVQLSHAAEAVGVGGEQGLVVASQAEFESKA